MIDQVLNNLGKSKFRSRFKLTDKDKKYIEQKGLEEIKKHAYQFIEQRLASDNILNDGKQTPMRGHPVFIAQHATATCCRNCLYKWHKIKPNKQLTNQEIDYIVDVIMGWIISDLRK